MDGVFDMGVTLFGCPLYFKTELEDAEMRKEQIVTFLRETHMPEIKSHAEYRAMAKETLGIL